uniref:G-protein coupled receptors family 3 profile domain-containing protein n=1 Tax=Ornithorhynchus anatinus TaxID=9258 RepID=F7FC30_ORNAN
MDRPVAFPGAGHSVGHRGGFGQSGRSRFWLTVSVPISHDSPRRTREASGGVGLGAPAHPTPPGPVLSAPSRPFGAVSRPLRYRYLTKHYQHLLALRFAVEEINKDPSLLPNTSLGFHIFNVHFLGTITAESSMALLSGTAETIPNYSCEPERRDRLLATRVVNVFQFTFPIPVQGRGLCRSLNRRLLFQFISYGPEDPTLRDKALFPSLYQISEGFSDLPAGMVRLLKHFRWVWVGLVVTGDIRGETFAAVLTEELAKSGIRVAYVDRSSVYLSETRLQLSCNPEQMITSSANVVIIYGDSVSLILLLYCIRDRVLESKVWITTSEWDVTSAVFYLTTVIFQGSLVFSAHGKEIPGFRDHQRSLRPQKYPQDSFLLPFWWFVFECPSPKDDVRFCEENGTLETRPLDHWDMNPSPQSVSVYSAVYAIAQALHQEIRAERDPEASGEGPSRLPRPWQVILPSVRPFLRRNGTKMLVKVGEFTPGASPGQDFTISEEKIAWAGPPGSVCSESCRPGFRKTAREGQAACCYDCVPCPEGEISDRTDVDRCIRCPREEFPNPQRDRCVPKAVVFLSYRDPLGMALASSALCLSLLTVLVLGVFVRHRDTPIVKANNRGLSYALLAALLLCFLSSLTFVGRPGPATCLLRQTAFGAAFSVAVSAVLAETVTVVLAFRATGPGICPLVQVGICTVWLATSPPFPDADEASEAGVVVVRCNEGSAVAFYCVLGYMGLLALVSFTAAFLARKLPDGFNEAKFITFSMLVFCSVWISFLPAYLSTRGKATVAVEVFSILASGAGLLGCIFGPKVYVILLRPDRNVRGRLLGRGGNP